MAKKHSYGKVTRKSLIAALCVMSVSCTALAAACTPETENKDPVKPSKTDTLPLKNGSFEFFDIPDDAVYLIKNVKDWSLGGGSSVKSGIIGTTPNDWDKLADDDLERKLEYNNDVGTSSDEYIDYNSMRSRDILFKEPYAATRTATQLKDDNIIANYGGLQKFLGIENDGDGYKLGDKAVYLNADDKDFYFDFKDGEYTNPVRKAVIDNPETHLGAVEEKNGEYTLGGEKLYKGEDGTLYSDETLENTVGNVLMVHNYTTDGKYNGIRQYYTSTTVTLEANTAAEISVWVKTSDLKFDKGYSALAEQDKGARIEVIQTVNGTEIDTFAVKNINTEKIISGAKTDDKTTTESNGWLNYKIYVNSCDFASSTIQLRLGLGGENEEQVTGYAFFDDVTVTKYRTLEDKECTYSANKDKVISCTLTSEADDKVFNADKELRVTNGEDKRNAYDFYYSIDLASTTGSTDNNVYSPVVLDANSFSAALTTEKYGLKLYASAAKNEANLSGVAKGDRAG
ncbi:MAG: hypothetical protein K2K80_04195, partial [Clostridia bacterium]|nr:hypothetical protein [Clostridia bacterium]